VPHMAARIRKRLDLPGKSRQRRKLIQVSDLWRRISVLKFLDRTHLALFRGHLGFEARGGRQIRVHSRLGTVRSRLLSLCFSSDGLHPAFQAIHQLM